PRINRRGNSDDFAERAENFKKKRYGTFSGRRERDLTCSSIRRQSRRIWRGDLIVHLVHRAICGFVLSIAAVAAAAQTTSDPFDGASIEKMSGQCVSLQTEQGAIVIEMLPGKAPETVRSFLN